jgi:hypothetical protein
VGDRCQRIINNNPVHGMNCPMWIAGRNDRSGAVVRPARRRRLGHDHPAVDQLPTAERLSLPVVSGIAESLKINWPDREPEAPVESNS